MAQLILPLTKRDHVKGPRSAPVTLVEYGDYECPYCDLAYWVVKDLEQSLGDLLCFAFRNFPLVTVHPHSEHAAEAAEAAASHGKFWEMHDCLFDINRHSTTEIWCNVPWGLVLTCLSSFVR